MKARIFSVLLFLLLACEAPPVQIPADVISEDKMIKVLVDVHLLEAVIANKNLPRDTSVLLYNAYQKDLLKKHQLTDSSYARSYRFYSSQPKMMEQLYEKILDELTLREGKQQLN